MIDYNKERPEWLSWMQPWDEERRNYNTRGNRCPRCGKEYPTHASIKDIRMFAVADAIEMGCVCDGCGLEFAEHWTWFEHDDGAIVLGYNDTFVKAAHNADGPVQE